MKLYSMIDNICHWFNDIFKTHKAKSLNLCLTTLLLITFSLIIPVFLRGNSFAVLVAICSVTQVAGLIAVAKSKSIRFSKIKKVYLILLEIVGFSFMITGLYFRVLGYIAIFFVLGVIVPISHMILHSYGEKNSLKCVANGIVIAFFIFLIISLVSGPPLGADQYFSFTSNPNIVGGLTVIVTAALIYLLFEAKDTIKKLAIIFLLGLSISICFFSQSRTSLVAILMQLLIAAVVATVRKLKYDKDENLKVTLKKSIKDLLMVIIIFALAWGTFFFSMTAVKKEISALLPGIQIRNASEQISLEKTLDISGARFTKGIDSRNGDAFTSGRIGLWSEFIRNIKIIGHKTESIKVNVNGRAYNGTNAHNVYLQIAYSAGAIAGIAMLLLMLTILKDLIFKLIYFIRVGDVSNELVFFVMAYIGFFIAALTSGGYMAYTYLPATLFWITLFVVSIKNERSCNDESLQNRI
ncbi:MAG: O-antigen ligase family protein [Peptostreptococcaceae bacterium]|nr:O-antigen ligase family protein [Peptostreptococcaceae bacterium]